MTGSDTDGASDPTDTLDHTDTRKSVGGTSIKRKASPTITSTPLMKRQNLSRLSKSKSSTRQKSVPFSELLLETIKEKNFLEGFFPVMQSAMCPLIETTVAKAMKANEKSMKELIESNKMLQEAAKKQMEELGKKQEKIESQEAELKEKEKRIGDLETTVSKLAGDLETLKLEQNDLQQYGRRNSLRISNMTYDDGITEADLTFQVAQFLNTKLELGYEKRLTTDDIERCHPVGKTDKKQILVKFSRYHAKNAVYSEKKKLKKHNKDKDNKERVFISEDLTKYNLDLVKKLLEKKKSGKINAVWTWNGNVYYKMTEESSRVQVKVSKDIPI